MRRALLLCLVAACTPPRAPAAPAPARSAFGCNSIQTPRPEPPDPTPPRLEINRRSPLHFEIRAEQATAAQLAAGIGQAIGETVVLGPGLVQERFTFYMPDATVADVDKLLSDGTGVHLRKLDNLWMMDAPGGGTKWAPDLEPITPYVISTHGHQTPEQVAALYCRVFSGPDGGAQVLGDGVLIFDRRSNAERFIAVLPKLVAP